MNTLLLILIGLIVLGLCIHIVRNACKESYDYGPYIPKISPDAQPIYNPDTDPGGMPNNSIEDCQKDAKTEMDKCMKGEDGYPTIINQDICNNFIHSQYIQCVSPQTFY